MYGAWGLHEVHWSEQRMAQESNKKLQRNVSRKALFHLWIWQQPANFSCLKTRTFVILIPFSHGVEYLNCCPCFPRPEAWKARHRNDLVFTVLHYHYSVFMVMTLDCVGIREEGCRNRAREAEVLPQQQGTQHAVLSITKHYLENVFFCRNITHRKVFFHTFTILHKYVFHPHFSGSTIVSPHFHENLGQKHRHALTITHAFIWRSRNVTFSFGMSP